MNIIRVKFASPHRRIKPRTGRAADRYTNEDYVFYISQLVRKEQIGLRAFLKGLLESPGFHPGGPGSTPGIEDPSGQWWLNGQGAELLIRRSGAQAAAVGPSSKVLNHIWSRCAVLSLTPAS